MHNPPLLRLLASNYFLNLQCHLPMLLALIALYLLLAPPRLLFIPHLNLNLLSPLQAFRLHFNKRSSLWAAVLLKFKPPCLPWTVTSPLSLLLTFLTGLRRMLHSNRLFIHHCVVMDLQPLIDFDPGGSS